MTNKGLSDRVFVGDGVVRDDKRNKPRFELIYFVKGDE